MSFLLRHHRQFFYDARVALVALLVLMGGCQNLPDVQQTASLNALRTEIEALREELSGTHASIDQLSVEEAQQRTELSDSLNKMDKRLGALPRSVSKACRDAESAPVPECAEEVVVKTDDRLVLGQLEYVWLEPPGISLVARIDTGAESSSVNAQNLVSFERDGDDWVRFDWVINGDTTTIERPIKRHVRVVQQADPSGTRRPVVSLRLRLGDTEDDFDFSLADRSHLDHQLNLGRNFLKDLAIVDVGREFIQPNVQNSN